MQLSDPQVAATQFTIYNSLSNLPVSFGAALFAVLGGTGEMIRVLWVAAALLAAGAMIYVFMKAGSRPVESEPVPRVD
jgi:predicted MFS family arabinose efflux permease